MLRQFLTIFFLISANVFAQNSVVIKPIVNNFSKNSNGGVWNAESSSVTFTQTYQDIVSPEALAAPTSAIVTIGGGCKDEQTFTMSVQQRKNLIQISSPIAELQCKEADKFRETKVLNQETCTLLANCFQTRSLLGTPDRKSLIKNAKEKTAAELISLIAPTTIDLLVDLERLKAYATSKYDSSFLPEECTAEDSLAIPDSVNSSCRTDIIDRGYEMAQVNCRKVDAGCNRDYLDFIEDKETINGKTSLMTEYFKKKSKESARELRTGDASIIREIAELMSNTSKSPEAVSDDVLNYLSRNRERLDPIYKSYIEESEKSKKEKTADEIKEGFVKYISSNRGKRAPEIAIELEMLRKKEAKNKLAADCKKVMTFPKLCKVVRDALEGSVVQVPKIAFENMVKMDGFSAMSSSLTRQELADNVSRCNIFSIESGVGKIGLPVRLSKGLNLFSTGSDGIFITKDLVSAGILSDVARDQGMSPQIIIRDNGEISRKEMLDSYVVEKLNSTKETKVTDTVFVASFAKNKVMQDPIRADVTAHVTPNNQAVDKIEAFDPAKSIAAKDESIKASNGKDSEIRNSTTGIQTQIQQPQTNGVIARNMIPNGARTQEAIIEDSFEIADKKVAADKVKQAPDYTNLITKISGLEDKLAAAQKKSAAVAETSATEARAVEESELARELRIAKASLADMNRNNLQEKLKENSATSSEVKAGREKAASQTSSNDDSESIAVASSGTISKDSRAIAPAVAPTSSGASSGGASSDGRAAASIESSGGASSARSGASASGAGTESSLGDGIVLTRLDGSNRAKASETISKMIIAESGKPFFIEEGGLVKEIIPEIVDGVLLKSEDGTPIYKIVVKGKVGEFKVDTKGKKTGKDVMVKVTSPADVKIQDYQKVNSPAIRYKELQEIFKAKK